MVDMRNIDLDMLYNEYVSGEIAETTEFEEFCAYVQFDMHPLTQKAYELAREKGMFLELDFYFDDVFTSLSSIDGSELPFDEQFDDEIQELISRSWTEVHNYFYMLDLIKKIEGFEVVLQRYSK